MIATILFIILVLALLPSQKQAKKERDAIYRSIARYTWRNL